MWLYDGYFYHNDCNETSSSRPALPSSFPSMEKAFHTSSYFVLPFFSKTQQMHGYVVHKKYMFSDAMIYVHC